MPVVLKWNLISKLTFKNKKELKDFLSSSLNAITTHKNKVTCNCCSNLEKGHQMNDIRLKYNSVSCNNENHLCEVKYKILQCSNKNKYEIYQIGKQTSEERETTQCRGIHYYVNDLIKDLIFEKDISQPKKIEIKLRGRKYASKFKNEIDIPSLEKIQNYTKYLRQKIGNNNKISDVFKFAEEHKFRELVDDDNFFVFGGDFGAGTDDDHFQLGFTSKNLLNRIPEVLSRQVLIVHHLLTLCQCHQVKLASLRGVDQVDLLGYLLGILARNIF
jgi:hypothetical protein